MVVEQCQAGDLADRCIGMRTYSQTTALWLRGTLLEEHGPRPDQVRWITFEDACARASSHGLPVAADQACPQCLVIVSRDAGFGRTPMLGGTDAGSPCHAVVKVPHS